MQELRLKVISLLNGQLNRRVVALAVLIAVGLVAILIALNSPKAYRVTTPSPAPTSISLQPAQIYVHVVGLVVSPGIYRLSAGARLVDAIFAAGGFRTEADQASVNLAREVADGEQVVVTDSAAVAQPSATGTQLISLNRATASQLEALPRVGPALAGRMVDWREANGGFKAKKDLLKVSGIGPKLFAEIEKLVTL